jgi:hypothetical protein
LKQIYFVLIKCEDDGISEENLSDENKNEDNQREEILISKEVCVFHNTYNTYNIVSHFGKKH